MRENDTFLAGAEEARSESEESVFVPRLRVGLGSFPGAKQCKERREGNRIEYIVENHISATAQPLRTPSMGVPSKMGDR